MFQKIFRGVVFSIAVMILVALIASPVFSQIYTYTSATAGDSYVDGAGYVTGYYNSSTHVYTTSITVISPSGRVATASCNGTFCSVSLSIGNEDGQYFASSSMVGTCPNVQGGSHPLGGGGSSTQVKPFVSINSVDITPAAICEGQNAEVKVHVSVSCTVAQAGVVGITMVESTRTGTVYYNLSPMPGMEKAQGVTCAGSNEYTWSLNNNSSSNTGNKVKLQAYVSSAPTTNPQVEVKNSPKDSGELTLSGNCPP